MTTQKTYILLTSLCLLACGPGGDAGSPDGGSGAGDGGGGGGGACMVSDENISLDNAVLDQAAMDAFDDCMNGANAASDPYRSESCQVLNLINADRAMFYEEANNAPSVQWNEELWEVAVAHSIDMCDRDFFGHTNPDGDGPTDRAVDAGITYPVGENLVSSGDVSSGHHGLMEEPTCAGHRSQILSPKVTSVGIGVARCSNFAVTEVFRHDLSIPESPYCAEDAPTYCRRPPTVFSSAECSSFCFEAVDVDVEAWGCPPC